MKRILALMLALCLMLAGCSARRDVEADAQPEATAMPAPTATPDPTSEEEVEDIDQNDEADYYFDFGQDDLIRLSYDVTWPQEKMADWIVQQSERVGALLALKKGESAITVIMEDAPEYANLDEFMVYAKQMLTFTYENMTLDREQATEDEQLLAGTLADGGQVQWRCRTVDGLYVTCELIARGEAAQADIEAFEQTFCPALQFTYTEIDSLKGCHGEE